MLLNLKVISAVNNSIEVILVNTKGLAIIGTVTEKKVPIPCRVRLFEKNTGRLIAETLTDAQGNYEFDHLTAVKFFLVAHHPASTYNAIIQDNVVPK
ncbi:carboxypeptidase regulatory-like domain-containing protein [Acinetobacter sp. R933-2]|uniref:carboxypeptidase regulatory-like domain-containing protein n=1 Tax=Acinetobacter sp. R933-2 TaxID=2746728 RepID=UPI002577EF16|nr:carboxypeptidase regulatory-like domain-containing protein [Acinetobacter sp. R933-2]MDM1247928.1 carboxypeptidase regulatory-like domain-containing protein [Acinetobacter sp. R933-2]